MFVTFFNSLKRKEVIKNGKMLDLQVEEEGRILFKISLFETMNFKIMVKK